MSGFDVIVIGGGLAGCYAALAAAAKGCTVALFEEDGAIGWPRHDPGWLMERQCCFSKDQACLSNRNHWVHQNICREICKVF